MGFGRSGTSLMGGILYNSGYFLGNHLHPARETNPKGFFEDMIINRINEQILEPFDYSKLKADFPVYPKQYSPFSPRRGHHWLAYIEPGTPIFCHDENIINQVKSIIALKQPFAFKDPRFNYTLPTWLPYLPEDTRFICMFRNPAAVVKSVLKECSSVDYLKDFYIDEELGYKIWHNFYRHLIDSLTPDLRSRMIFIDYEDLIDGKCTAEISKLLDSELSTDFIEPTLNRSRSEAAYPLYICDLYRELASL
jgi:hypothetical protein